MKISKIIISSLTSSALLTVDAFNFNAQDLKQVPNYNTNVYGNFNNANSNYNNNMVQQAPNLQPLSGPGPMAMQQNNQQNLMLSSPMGMSGDPDRVCDPNDKNHVCATAPWAVSYGLSLAITYDNACYASQHGFFKSDTNMNAGNPIYTPGVCAAGAGANDECNLNAPVCVKEMFVSHTGLTGKSITFPNLCWVKKYFGQSKFDELDSTARTKNVDSWYRNGPCSENCKDSCEIFAPVCGQAKTGQMTFPNQCAASMMAISNTPLSHGKCSDAASTVVLPQFYSTSEWLDSHHAPSGFKWEARPFLVPEVKPPTPVTPAPVAPSDNSRLITFRVQECIEIKLVCIRTRAGDFRTFMNRCLAQEDGYDVSPDDPSYGQNGKINDIAHLRSSSAEEVGECRENAHQRYIAKSWHGNPEAGCEKLEPYCSPDGLVTFINACQAHKMGYTDKSKLLNGACFNTEIAVDKKYWFAPVCDSEFQTTFLNAYHYENAKKLRGGSNTILPEDGACKRWSSQKRDSIYNQATTQRSLQYIKTDSLTAYRQHCRFEQYLDPVCHTDPSGRSPPITFLNVCVMWVHKITSNWYPGACKRDDSSSLLLLQRPRTPRLTPIEMGMKSYPSWKKFSDYYNPENGRNSYYYNHETVAMNDQEALALYQRERRNKIQENLEAQKKEKIQIARPSTTASELYEKGQAEAESSSVKPVVKRQPKNFLSLLADLKDSKKEFQKYFGSKSWSYTDYTSKAKADSESLSSHPISLLETGTSQPSSSSTGVTTAAPGSSVTSTGAATVVSGSTVSGAATGSPGTAVVSTSSTLAPPSTIVAPPETLWTISNCTEIMPICDVQENLITHLNWCMAMRAGVQSSVGTLFKACPAGGMSIRDTECFSNEHGLCVFGATFSNRCSAWEHGETNIEGARLNAENQGCRFISGIDRDSPSPTRNMECTQNSDPNAPDYDPSKTVCSLASGFQDFKSMCHLQKQQGAFWLPFILEGSCDEMAQMTFDIKGIWPKCSTVQEAFDRFNSTFEDAVTSALLQMRDSSEAYHGLNSFKWAFGADCKTCSGAYGGCMMQKLESLGLFGEEDYQELDTSNNGNLWNQALEYQSYPWSNQGYYTTVNGTNPITGSSGTSSVPVSGATSGSTTPFSLLQSTKSGTANKEFMSQKMQLELQDALKYGSSALNRVQRYKATSNSALLSEKALSALKSGSQGVFDAFASSPSWRAGNTFRTMKVRLALRCSAEPNTEQAAKCEQFTNEILKNQAKLDSLKMLIQNDLDTNLAVFNAQVVQSAEQARIPSDGANTLTWVIDSSNFVKDYVAILDPANDRVLIKLASCVKDPNNVDHTACATVAYVRYADSMLSSRSSITPMMTTAAGVTGTTAAAR